MIEERRKYIRIPVGLEFLYKVKGDKTDVKQKSITKNISPGGIQGFVNAIIKNGDVLEMDIKIPTSKYPVSALGKVVWTAEQYGDKIDAGIKFEEIEPEAKNRFLEYICELMYSELERLRI